MSFTWVKQSSICRFGRGVTLQRSRFNSIHSTAFMIRFILILKQSEYNLNDEKRLKILSLNKQNIWPGDLENDPVKCSGANVNKTIPFAEWNWKQGGVIYSKCILKMFFNHLIGMIFQLLRLYFWVSLWNPNRTVSP